MLVFQDCTSSSLESLMIPTNLNFKDQQTNTFNKRALGFKKEWCPAELQKNSDLKLIPFDPVPT